MLHAIARCCEQHHTLYQLTCLWRESRGPAAIIGTQQCVTTATRAWKCCVGTVGFLRRRFLPEKVRVIGVIMSNRALQISCASMRARPMAHYINAFVQVESVESVGDVFHR